MVCHWHKRRVLHSQVIHFGPSAVGDDSVGCTAGGRIAHPRAAGIDIQYLPSISVGSHREG